MESRRSSESLVDSDIMEEENFSMPESNPIDFSKYAVERELEEKLQDIRQTVEQRPSTLSIKVNPELIKRAQLFIQKEWNYICESNIDTLFFKPPQSPEKGAITGVVWQQFKNFAGESGYASQDAILNISDGQRAPDVAFWSVRPTREQRKHPLADNCPVPHVWVEIAYSRSDDKRAALDKIRDVVIPSIGGSCTILLIVLPNTVTDAMLHRIGAEEGKVRDTTEAAQQVTSPYSPYVSYWAPGTAYEGCVYCRVKRNQHLTIVVPGRDEHFRLSFNEIIDEMV